MPKTKDVLEIVSCGLSLAFLVFCIVLVMASVFDHGTKLSQDVHPAFAFCAIWFGIVWLHVMEGSQVSLVGLPPVQRDLYHDTHPMAYRICSTIHQGAKLDQYLIGRQFLVVLIILLIHVSSSPLKYAEAVFDWPSIVSRIFLTSGVAVTFMTSMMGQINAQHNASSCMLDSINNWFAWLTVQAALALEATGILHAVYLVQYVLSLFGKPMDFLTIQGSSGHQKILFWIRVVMSLVILGFAFAVSLSALLDGITTLWGNVSKPLAVTFFFVLLAFMGMLEGIPIAIAGLTKLPVEERADHPIVLRTCAFLSNKEGGYNVPTSGRQVLVTFTLYVLARVATPNAEKDSTVFGVSQTFQEFFNSGILGAIITTIVGSISWQLFASAFPMQFLSNPLIYLLLRFCAFLETIGILSGSMMIAELHKKVAGLQADNTYIGTPEERAAKHKGDVFAELDSMMHFGTATPHAVGGIWYPPSGDEEQSGVDEAVVDAGHDQGSHVFVPASEASPAHAEINLCRTPSSLHSSVPDADRAYDRIFFNQDPPENRTLSAAQLYVRSPEFDSSREEGATAPVVEVGVNFFHQESNILSPDSETDATPAELHISRSTPKSMIDEDSYCSRTRSRIRLSGSDIEVTMSNL